jgi:hypothetical protein
MRARMGRGPSRWLLVLVHALIYVFRPTKSIVPTLYHVRVAPGQNRCQRVDPAIRASFL